MPVLREQTRLSCATSAVRREVSVCYLPVTTIIGPLLAIRPNMTCILNHQDPAKTGTVLLAVTSQWRSPSLLPHPAVKPDTCSSTGSEKWARFFSKKITTLQPGSPCNDFKGYCDVFMRCRLVDADGPLARLKKAIFNAELYENIAEWIVVSVPGPANVLVVL